MKIERTEVATGVIIAIVGGILVAVITPTLTLLGGRIASFLYPPPAAVTIQACAPLKSAREIMSFQSPTKGLQVLEDFNRHVRNETFVYVENKSGKDLRDAFLSIYPISITGDSADLSTAEMLFTAIHRSSDYKYVYDKSHHTMGITIPVLGNSDSLLIDQVYNVPVGFIVELSAEGFNERKIFKPGCPDQILVNDLLVRSAEPYIGDNCKTKVDPDNNSITGTLCTYTDQPEKPMKFTEEMRGKSLRIEDYTDTDPTRLSLKMINVNRNPVTARH